MRVIMLRVGVMVRVKCVLGFQQRTSGNSFYTRFCTTFTMVAGQDLSQARPGLTLPLTMRLAIKGLHTHHRVGRGAEPPHMEHAYGTGQKGGLDDGPG